MSAQPLASGGADGTTKRPAHNRSSVAPIPGATSADGSVSRVARVLRTRSHDAPLAQVDGAVPADPVTRISAEKTGALARIPEATLDAARAVNRHYAERLAALLGRASGT